MDDVAHANRIVVIDDDEVDRLNVVRHLHTVCAVIEAKTAEEGIDAHRRFKPDCVLLDYRLPDANGLKLLPDFVAFGTPVVMLTGEGDETVAVDAMKAGAFDYIPKNRLDRLTLISAIRRAIDKSRLEAKVRSTRKELEEFVASAAHDLKSPLATVEGYAQAVLDEDGAKLAEFSREALSRTVALTSDLTRLIDHMIRYTQVGRGADEFVEIDLNEAAEAAVNRLRHQLVASRGDLLIDRLPIVRGTDADLRQLFQNLFANAIKFRGEVAPEIRVTAALRGPEWMVSVVDNGIGIPEKDREAVFAPLKRAHVVDRDDYEGFGLGLATCRKIVDQHSGRIWADEGAGGRGTAIRFTLPASEAQIRSGSVF